MRYLIALAIALCICSCSDSDCGAKNEVSQYSHHDVVGNTMILQEYYGLDVTPEELNQIEADGWKCVHRHTTNSRFQNDEFTFERIKPK